LCLVYFCLLPEDLNFHFDFMFFRFFAPPLVYRALPARTLSFRTSLVESVPVCLRSNLVSPSGFFFKPRIFFFPDFPARDHVCHVKLGPFRFPQLKRGLPPRPSESDPVLLPPTDYCFFFCPVLVSLVCLPPFKGACRALSIPEYPLLDCPFSPPPGSRAGPLVPHFFELSQSLLAVPCPRPSFSELSEATSLYDSRLLFQPLFFKVQDTSFALAIFTPTSCKTPAFLGRRPQSRCEGPASFFFAAFASFSFLDFFRSFPRCFGFRPGFRCWFQHTVSLPKFYDCGRFCVDPPPYLCSNLVFVFC